MKKRMGSLWHLPRTVAPAGAAGYPARAMKFKALGAAEEVDSLAKGIPGPVVVLASRWCATPWDKKPDEAADKAAAPNEAMAQAHIEPLAELNPDG